MSLKPAKHKAIVQHRLVILRLDSKHFGVNCFWSRMSLNQLVRPADPSCSDAAEQNELSQAKLPSDAMIFLVKKSVCKTVLFFFSHAVFLFFGGNLSAPWFLNTSQSKKCCFVLSSSHISSAGRKPDGASFHEAPSNYNCHDQFRDSFQNSA